MIPPHRIRSLLLLLLLLRGSAGEVGSAASYRPPYIPTACYGDDTSQIPENAEFAAAGQGIWDNGSACGRRYVVRCLSSSTAKACVDGATVEVIIVDRAAGVRSQPSADGTTLALSQAAYRVIADLSAPEINIELAVYVLSIKFNFSMRDNYV
ncbi:EG45-like domain containing protein 2 [Apostasia shenzhenica]|uniref:EG45-like domain containing protein 2 n=1 Tax=Apostasia shenzhenica TaxID=1088818 RepID=A0A2I0BA64_9ASPA|nr:EG45-like domain containing protein 2 [Apostasia shenzhenica]